MRLSALAFEALYDEVEAQGGALLPESHVSESIHYKKSDGYIHNRTLKEATCGCGHAVRLVSEYLNEEGKSSFVTACAVCDNVGLYPRYLEAVVEADPSILPRDEPYNSEEDEDDDAY